MPKQFVKKLAKEKGISTHEAEAIWEKAKKIASGEGHANEFDYITGVFKKMMGVKSSDDFISSGDFATHAEPVGALRKRKNKMSEETTNEDEIEGGGGATDDTIAPPSPNPPNQEYHSDGAPIFDLPGDEFSSLVNRNHGSKWSYSNPAMNDFVKTQRYKTNDVKFWARDVNNPNRAYKYISPAKKKD